MPYNPSERNRVGDYIMAAGQSLQGSIGDAMKNWEKQKEKKEELERDIAYSDQIMTNALEKGRIDLEDYNAYTSAGANKKKSIAQGTLFNAMDDYKRQQAEIDNQRAQEEMSIRRQGIANALAAQKENDFMARANLGLNAADQTIQDDAAAAAKAAREKSMEPTLPEQEKELDAAGFVRIRDADGSHKVVQKPRTKTQTDNIAQLQKDFGGYGGSVGDWLGAENKRVKDGFVMADVIDPGNDKVKKTIKMPVTEYRKAVQRYNTITGSPMTGDPVADIARKANTDTAPKPVYSAELIAQAQAVMKDPNAPEDRKKRAKIVLGL